MLGCSPPGSESASHACAFYRRALMALQAAQVPFLVGGGHALSHYTGIIRHTKDFDIFVYPHHCAHALVVLHTTGYYTEMTFPHWLGKACSGPDCIDVIFSSGNCIATVDEAWFAHAVAGNTLGIPVHFLPARRNALVQELCYGT